MANEAIKEIAGQEYKWGFNSTIESDVIAAGLSERCHPAHLIQKE